MAQCTKSRYSAVHEQYALCTLFKHTPQTTMALYTKIMYYVVLCTFEPLQPSARTVCTVYFQAQAPLRPLHLSPLHTSSLLNQVHSAPPLLPRQPFLASIISLLPHYFSLFFNHCPFSPSSPALVFLNIPPWIVSFDPFSSQAFSIFLFIMSASILPSPQTFLYCSLLDGLSPSNGQNLKKE